jgi:hypothetical protein
MYKWYMPYYHAVIWPKSTRQQMQHELYGFNLTDEQLAERFIEPYEFGEPITWEGRTLDGGDITYLKISETEQPWPEEVVTGFRQYDAWKSGQDVTNHFVIRAPGSRTREPATADHSTGSGGASVGAVWSAQSRVVDLCRRFLEVADQLAKRHDKRETLVVDDEYDVQDLMHALLWIDFQDVRSEEYTPSYAGSSSRIDFILKREQLALEIKFAHKSKTAKAIGDELLIDIGRYKEHRDVKVLICFIHDPERRIQNSRGLEGDLTGPHDHLQVIVVVA